MSLAAEQDVKTKMLTLYFFLFVYQVDPSGEIICFRETFCPWKDHLMTLEEELHIDKPIKFVLYTDQSGKWRVQCVPIEIGSFDNRYVHSTTQGW